MALIFCFFAFSSHEVSASTAARRALLMADQRTSEGAHCGAAKIYGRRLGTRTAEKVAAEAPETESLPPRF